MSDNEVLGLILIVGIVAGTLLAHAVFGRLMEKRRFRRARRKFYKNLEQGIIAEPPMLVTYDGTFMRDAADIAAWIHAKARREGESRKRIPVADTASLLASAGRARLHG